MAGIPPSPALECVQEAQMGRNARIHTHTRRKRGYSVAFSPAKSEYKIIYFKSFWASLRFWREVRRHPNINNVKWEIE